MPLVQSPVGEEMGPDDRLVPSVHLADRQIGRVEIRDPLGDRAL